MTTSNTFGGSNALLTPPTTPKTTTTAQFSQLPTAINDTSSAPSLYRPRSDTDPYTFLDIDSMSLDIENAPLLGRGLWSNVYKWSPFVPLPLPPLFSTAMNNGISEANTPPSTPQSAPGFPAPSSFAIKVATRPDALAVFESEARINHHLQAASRLEAEKYIIPFHGFSPRSKALVFALANAGTLGDLISTSASRPPSERLRIFSVLAPQLIAGLAFIHSRGVVHADIKFTNILLSHDSSNGELVARFADFGASFRARNTEEVSGLHAAGTWEFMAPEQLNRDVTVAMPSFASDVYSLGVTLLGLLGGGGCYDEVTGSLFMLREAVKIGDPLGFGQRGWGFERCLEETEREWKRQGGEGTLAGLMTKAVTKGRRDRCSAQAWLEQAEDMGLGN